METETIKSFLLGLGFDIDEIGLAKFSKAIASASVKVAALYTSIQVASAGIFYGISKMAQSFEEIGYSLRLVAPAVNKMLILRAAMLDAYKRAGIDLKKVVQQAILFNYSLAKTKFALEAIYKSVAAKFFPLLTKQMDIFRHQIFANMPKIQELLGHLVTFLFKAFKVTIQLGTTMWGVLGHVWNFLKKLDEATGGWSTNIMLAVAAWRLLNLSFIATPLGLILTGLLAILALWDDFTVWEKGGVSLFNWKKALPVMNALRDILSSIGTLIQNIGGVFKDFLNADESHLVKRLEAITDAFGKIGLAIDRIVKSLDIPIINKILEWRDKIDAKAIGAITNTFGNNSAQWATSPSWPSPLLPPTPINNQKVNQETNINVNGAADAQSVGKAVAGEQNRVNMDMTRNMRGALV